MITEIKNGSEKRRPLSWYKEELRKCVERERLNHSYKRIVLLETLYEMRTPVSAENLYFVLSRDGGGRISINTVYRIIKLFVSCDLLIQTESNGSLRYILNTFEDFEISVVCRQSGKTYTLDAPRHWQFQLVQMLKKRGVDIAGSVELRVDCTG